VLPQAGCADEDKAALKGELDGGDCKFEKAMGGLRLPPVAFISQWRPSPSSSHSFVGEGSTGQWAVLKLKRCLTGQELTWIADCSGLTKFFETDCKATHAIQRWKLKLSQLNCAIAHRPGRMLTDHDVLLRHNTWTNKWRKEEGTDKWTSKQQRKEEDTLPAALLATISREETEERTPLIPRTQVNPKAVGANTVNHQTLLASTCNRACTLWIIGTGAETATTAMTNLGLEPLPVQSTDKEECWQTTSDALNLRTFAPRFEQREDHLEETPKWTVVLLPHSFFQSTKLQDQLKVAITKGKTLNCKALTCLWRTLENNTEDRQAVLMKEWLNYIGWQTTSGQIRNKQHDGYI
jgi:hypothetical protein